jgi:PaREP6 domain containing protein
MQPPRLRAALRYYVETGDFRTAARLAGLGVEEFLERAREAKIPLVL